MSKNTPKKMIPVCFCGTPLIWTFAFSGAEYYCLYGGHQFGMLGVDKAEWTPELQKTLTTIKRKWGQIRRNLLSGGAMLRDCKTCSEKHEPHLHHATDEEKRKHQQALKKLEEYTN